MLKGKNDKYLYRVVTRYALQPNWVLSQNVVITYLKFIFEIEK